MLSEERVKVMTKMAMEERKLGRLPDAAGMTRKEYVGNRKMAAFLLGSMVYIVLFMAVFVLAFLFFYETMTLTTIILLFMAGLAGYLVFLFIVLTRTAKKARRRHRQMRQRRELLQSEWEELERLYAMEERDG